MAFQQLLPIQNHSQPLTAGPVDDPNTIARIDFRFQTANFTNPANTMTLAIEESRDGGATWRFAGGDTWSGSTDWGTATNRDGSIRWPHKDIELGVEENFQRQWRARMTYVGTVRHGVEVEVTNR